MPNSLARVLSSALDYSSHPPELVSGTVCTDHTLEDFLGSMDSAATTLACLGVTSRPCSRGFACENSLLASTGTSNTRPCLSFCVSPSKSAQVRELLTRFPSATPFSLALGADLPWEDYLYPGNLGFTANRFLACFIVTHVSIITSLSSTDPSEPASAFRERSPTIKCCHSIRSFGSMLSPVTFSAQRH